MMDCLNNLKARRRSRRGPRGSQALTGRRRPDPCMRRLPMRQSRTSRRRLGGRPAGLHDMCREAAPCAGSACPARHPPVLLRRPRCAPARGHRRSGPSPRAGGAQAMRAVEIPIYDFTRHQRSSETRRVEPADVVILEVRGALQPCSQ